MNKIGIQIDSVYRLIRELSKILFWGRVTLFFEKGRIVYVKKEETFKDLPKSGDLSGTKEEC